MKLKSLFLSLSFFALLFGGFAAQANDQPMLVTVKRMSMEVAQTIAYEAVKACRKEGIQVGVVVVDRTGVPQVVLRDVLAPDLTIRVAERKAYSAVVFNMATGDMEGRFKGAYSVPKDDRMVVARGGLPIQAGGRILGAVGVSGAPSGELDEKCAKAGLEAILDDLEMAD